MRHSMLEQDGKRVCGSLRLTVSLSGHLPDWIARHARTIDPARMARHLSSHGRSNRWLDRSVWRSQTNSGTPIRKIAVNHHASVIEARSSPGLWEPGALPISVTKPIDMVLLATACSLNSATRANTSRATKGAKARPAEAVVTKEPCEAHIERGNGDQTAMRPQA